MAEQTRHAHHIDALRQQQACARVAQIVKANLSNAGTTQCWLEATMNKIHCILRIAGRVRKDEVV